VVAAFRPAARRFLVVAAFRATVRHFGVTAAFFAASDGEDFAMQRIYGLVRTSSTRLAPGFI